MADGQTIALVGIGLTLVAQLGTVAVVVWRGGRKDGELVTEARSMATEIRRLATSMDRHADALAAVAQDNAIQDARLNEHDRRLDGHDEAISELRRVA